MNIVKIYIGITEITKHYRVNYMPEECAPYRDQFKLTTGPEKCLMTSEKYKRICTQGDIPHEIRGRFMESLYFYNEEDCKKAVRNLRNYLFERDYK